MNKIRIADNLPLNDAEYSLCSQICDIIAAVEDQMPSASAPRGIHWGELGDFPTIHRLKRRTDFDVAVLLPNGFRDFPTVAYDDDRWTPRPDYWMRRYCRLCSALAAKWHVRLPARFGEIGWEHNGHPVNRHVSVLQERVLGLHILGVLRDLERLDELTILEIGAGGGEMGYLLSKGLDPNLRWINCDIPRSLAFAATRLAVLLPEKKHAIYVGACKLPAGVDQSLVLRSPREVVGNAGTIVSVPHFLFDELVPHLSARLAFNAWSFGEMSGDIASAYVASIKRILGRSGVLVEQNGDLASLGGTATKKMLREMFAYRRDANERLPASSPIRSGHLELWANGPIPSDIDWPDAQEMAEIITAMDDGNDVCDIEFPLQAWRDLQRYDVDISWMRQFEAWAAQLASGR